MMCFIEADEEFNVSDVKTLLDAWCSSLGPDAQVLGTTEHIHWCGDTKYGIHIEVLPLAAFIGPTMFFSSRGGSTWSLTSNPPQRTRNGPLWDATSPGLRRMLLARWRLMSPERSYPALRELEQAWT